MFVINAIAAQPSEIEVLGTAATTVGVLVALVVAISGGVRRRKLDQQAQAVLLYATLATVRLGKRRPERRDACGW